MSATGDSQAAVVVAAHGRRGRLQAAGAAEHPYVVRGRRLRVVCGDRVQWQPGLHSEVTVIAIEPRNNSLRRLDTTTNKTEVLAANLSLVAVVCAVEPQPDWFVLDRYLCAAADMGAGAVIVVNKSDLGRPNASELEAYRTAGYRVLEVSARTGQGLDELAATFDGETGILVGQSGAGKSSLINRLVPGVDVSTGALTRGTAEGRHTTTASVMHALPGGGRLIDAPGVRDFLPAIDDDRAVQVGFAEILAAAAQCRFGDCRHMREPGCAVKSKVQDGTISERRYESYRRLLRSTQSAASH
ncbi:MAG: ribosome small subunit-dependent GTPase A [Chromatiales bacterium]|nr:MAG: ribosome small subunit-dependent GTPase A [Chromatiales bacterium]